MKITKREKDMVINRTYNYYFDSWGGRKHRADSIKEDLFCDELWKYKRMRDRIVQMDTEDYALNAFGSLLIIIPASMFGMAISTFLPNFVGFIVGGLAWILAIIAFVLREPLLCMFRRDEVYKRSLEFCDLYGILSDEDLKFLRGEEDTRSKLDADDFLDF